MIHSGTSDPNLIKSNISGVLFIIYFHETNLMFIEIDFNRVSQIVKGKIRAVSQNAPEAQK